MASRVYEMLARISLEDTASRAMAALAARAMHLEGKITALTKAFTELGRTTALVGGGLAIFGGVKGLEAINKAVAHGEKLVHVQQQLSVAGLTQKEVAEATAKAWETAGKLGLNVSDVLADIKEMRQVFSSTEDAVKFVDQLERMRVTLNSVTQGSGERLRGAVYDMARAGELKGLVDTGEFLRVFPQLTKAIIASGGKVDPRALFQATQYGRLASFGLSEEFYTKYFPTLIQSMRPSTAGVSLQSLLMQGAMGHVGPKGTEAWRRAGLIENEKLLNVAVPATKKHGEIFGGWQFGAVRESEQLVENPYTWAQKFLGPILREKFGANVSAKDPRVIGFLGTLFTNRVAQQGIAEFALQGRRFDRDRRLIELARDDAAETLLRHDPTAVMNRFKNSWDNLLTAFSEPLVEPKIKMMNTISDAMSRMTKLAIDHPDATKLIGEIFVGIAGGLVVLGGAAVIGGLVSLAGPAGLIAALAAAIGLLAAANWGGVKAGIDKLIANVGDLGQDIWNLFKEAIAKGLDHVTEFSAIIYKSMKESLIEALASIGNVFKDWGKDIVNYFRGKFGLQPISFGGGGDFGSSAGALSAGERGQYAGIIRKVAMQEGVDPNSLLKIYGTEGASAWFGDSGKSFGPFQLYTGGGLGNIYRGSRERSAQGVEEQTRFVARWGRAHGGWSSDIWHGLRGHGGSIPYRPTNIDRPPARRTQTVETNIYLDGRVLARHVTRHQVAAATHSHQAPHFDGYRMYSGPDRQVNTG